MGTEHEEINTAGQTKNEEKKSFADWLIELANFGFGMSTDAFL